MKPFKRYSPFLLMTIGALLVLWPVGQKAYGWIAQRQLQQQWKSTFPHQQSPSPKPKAQTKTQPAWQPTKLVIPQLHVNAVIVNGFDKSALRRGPAHDPQSALPGQPGNFVLAAHRNVYGSWFADIDQLHAGSKVLLETPTQTYTYHTVSIMRVSEANQKVLLPPKDGSSVITLITCTLPHSSDRLVVQGVLGDAF